MDLINKTMFIFFQGQKLPKIQDSILAQILLKTKCENLNGFIKYINKLFGFQYYGENPWILAKFHWLRISDPVSWLHLHVGIVNTHNMCINQQQRENTKSL